MKRVKCFLALFIMMCTLITQEQMTVFATELAETIEEISAQAETEKTGTLGDNGGFHWTYDMETKTLTVTGEDTGLNGEGKSPFEDIATDMEKIVFQDCRFKGSVSSLLYGLKTVVKAEFFNCNTSKVTDMSNMFSGCSNLSGLDVSGFDTGNVTYMSGMFEGCSGLSNLDVRGFDTSKVTYMGGMFRGCSGLSNLDVNGFDTSNVESMEMMFFKCSKLSTLDVSGFDTSKVTDMDGMFGECSGLSNLDVSGFDTSEVTGMYGMFSGCSGLSNLDVSGFDTSKVPDMSGMFAGCSGLSNLDVSGFDTSKVESMIMMFLECSKLSNLDVSGFDTSKVTDMTCMFDSCSELSSLDVSGFDTSKVTYMGGMFRGCSGLSNLDVSGFDTSKVTDMDGMFDECSGLSNLDVSGFDTSEVTGMYGMFSGCSGLSNLDVSGFDTSKVPDMSGMFAGCSGLSDLDVRGFDTSKVTDMYGMFSGCSGLSNLDVSGFDTSKVTDMRYMFDGCSELRNLDVSGFDTSKVTDMRYMFDGCSELRNLDVSGFDTSKVTDMSVIFYECSGLETICLPKSLGEGKTISLPGTFYDSYMNSYTLITSQDCGKILFKKKNVEDVHEYKSTYSIQVIDVKGNPISGANVTYDNQNGVTNSEGTVKFELIDADEVKISVSKSNYKTWEDEVKAKKDFIPFNKKIILYKVDDSDSKLKSAYYAKYDLKNQDVLVTTKTLNLKNKGNLVGDLTSGDFTLFCEAMNTANVKEYQLWQKKKKIAISTNGTFSLNVEDGFVEGGNCFIKVVSKDGEEIDTPINLSFVSNDVNENTSISLMEKSVSFKVGEDIPYLGNSEIKIDFPDLPVRFEVTDEKVYVGFNVGYDSSDKGESFTDKVKKKINAVKNAKDIPLGKKNQEEIKNLIKEPKEFKLPGGKFEVDIIGYAEGNIGSSLIEGEIYISVKGTSPTFGFNTWVYVVPVTVQVKATVEGTAGYDFSFNWHTGEFDGCVKLGLEVGVNAFGGIGVGKAIGVGAYGDAKVKVETELFCENPGVQNVDLTGELGLKVYVGCLTYERPFAYNTWHLYTANPVSTYGLVNRNESSEPYNSSNYKVESLDYLKEESEWNGYAIATNDIEANTNLISLVENTYRNAQPVMVSDGNVAYAAFLRADADTNAIYAVCTKMENGVWSEPVQADTTAMLDNAPQLVLDEEGILWMAYATTQEEADTTNLLDYAQNQRIVIGTVNTETLEFTKVKEFDSAGYAHMQQLTLVNGVPRLIWVESTVTDDNSVLASKENRILLSSCENGEWSESEEVKQINNYIQEIAIGDTGFANIVDMDSDLTTTEDWTLVCYDWLGAETASVTGVAGNVTYGVLPGETESSFLWNGTEQLCSLTSSIVVAGITNDYVVSDGNIYYSAPVTGGTELAVLKQNTDGTFGEPIYLTDSDRYLENLSVVNVSGKDIILGMHTEVEILEDSVTPSKNLVWAIVQPVNDIRIDNMEYDAEIVTPGEMIPVTVTVANSGDHVVEEVCVSVDDTVVATETVNLQPGTNADIAFEIACPESLTEYSVLIEDTNSDLLSDYTSDDNSATLKLGHANLSVDASVQKFGKNRIVVAEVKNIGTDKVSGTVAFSDENGNLLSLSSFSELERENMLLIEVPLLTTLSDSTINVVVTAEQEEIYTYDNLDTVYVYSEEDEYQITYELDGGIQNEMNPLTYFPSEEKIVLQEPTREHYQFEGWYSDSEYYSQVTEITTGSTKNIKLYAKWSATDFSINYELDGGKNSSSNPSTYNIETETFVLENPTKDGFAFEGWFEDLTYETEVTQIEQGATGNITLYAKWTPYEYIISFDGNGATSGRMEEMVGVEYGTEYELTANDFKRHGYTFMGWNTVADGSGIAYDDKASVINLSLEDEATVTLYAQWEIVKYTIAYNLNGGKNHSNNPSEYFVTTETITLENPTKEGYQFEGWYSSPSYETKVTQIKQGTTGNKTLYAKWTKISYVITYELNGGTNSSNNPAGFDITSSTITFENAKKTGHTFAGWYTDANYTNPITQLPEGSTGDITLYAKWEVNEYSIKFAGNGATSGSMSTMKDRKYGTKYTLTANVFKRNGYEFVGWNTKADGSGTVYADKASVLNLSVNDGVTITLYAQWVSVKYTIIYNLNGGKNHSNNPSEYFVTTETISLGIPTKEGYQFEGWYSSPSYETKITQIKQGTTGNKTLYAKWTKISYVITYELNGGTNSSNNPAGFDITSSTITFENAKKTGNTFAGWYTDANYTAPITQLPEGSTGDITLYAKWEVNKYSIKFAGNGATSGSMSAMKDRKYGTKYTLTANAFKRSGYEFVGWNTKADGSGTVYADKASVLNLSTKDGATITLYAQWKKNDINGLVRYEQGWVYVKNGEIDITYTGLCKYNGSWFYVEKGILDWNYTGLCKHNGNWFYVQKGVLNWNYTGLCKHNGNWFYVQKGVLNWNYTGLCKYNGNWFYVQKGVLNWNYTGLCKYGSSWYYVKTGILNWNYTGLCKYGSTWYHIQKGVLNWNYTGLSPYNGSWYYVTKGIIDWKYTGLTKYDGNWYYVQKGILNWNYTGLCKYGSSWYYVQKGKLNWNYTGLCKYGSNWYYVQKGTLNWNYTGLCKYGSTWYYVQKGVLNWNYTGYTTYNGSKWYVQSGVMVKKA